MASPRKGAQKRLASAATASSEPSPAQLISPKRARTTHGPSTDTSTITSNSNHTSSTDQPSTPPSPPPAANSSQGGGSIPTLPQEEPTTSTSTSTTALLRSPRRKAVGSEVGPSTPLGVGKGGSGAARTALFGSPERIQDLEMSATTALSTGKSKSPSGSAVKKPRKGKSPAKKATPAKSPGRKKADKDDKGLRHFSLKVCEKVQAKSVTSYQEVADELVKEISGTDALDHKNLRRRVYDALNVLMAMNIISKHKKEIRWIGLPTMRSEERSRLDERKRGLKASIEAKRAQLRELAIQQVAWRNLSAKRLNEEHKARASDRIQLPFILINTGRETVIECEMAEERNEVFFNFSHAFEIHDDIEISKRLGHAQPINPGEDPAGHFPLHIRKALAKTTPPVVDGEPGNEELAGTLTDLARTASL